MRPEAVSMILQTKIRQSGQVKQKQVAASDGSTIEAKLDTQLIARTM
jgi:hypothetical protein